MSFENDKYSVDKDPYEWCLRQSKIPEAIDPQMNVSTGNQKLLKQMPGELDHAIKCICNQSFTLCDIANTLKDVRKRKNIGKNSLNRGNSFKEKQTYRFENKDKPKEKQQM
ncbi:hypothetical protein O181_067796 [Austropuccinia psidii MF-1]|uniref:Uncharacterized protein n=1 Tax=Austropuccinia psidii MF-1 TaxID=1389203 RepID=A0A9Q3F0E3_9BASI|nr:hypothetical protein [Austropuccinia psidii MF-1]